MWHTTKMAFWILASGIVMGGYTVHAFETERLMGFAERGYCVARDVAKTRYFYNCLDAAVQLDMQQRQAARDADTDTILSSMALNQPKKTKVRK